MKKLNAGDAFFIIAGILILALAGTVVYSAHGHITILAILLGAVGIVAIIFGLLYASVIGVILAIVLVKFIAWVIEIFPIPVAIVLGLVGIASLIYGIKGD